MPFKARNKPPPVTVVGMYFSKPPYTPHPPNFNVGPDVGTLDFFL